MPGFHLHRGNRLELLADALAGVIHVPLASPFTPEVILVQSQGMARWLKLELATRLGIAANLRFPFPRAFAHELFRALDLTVDARPSYDPETFTWRLFHLLPAAAQRGGFGPVARYLADGDQRKRFQLAQRLARLFDSYLVYRPELIRAWETGDASWVKRFDVSADDLWQEQLWGMVRDGWAAGHPARWLEEFLRASEQDRLPVERLSERVCVFGVSSLPPFHLDLFAALGRVAEVHLFLLQPTEHYWGDIRSRREQAALRRRGKSLGETATEEVEGHRLVASLGRTGREMLDLLLDRDAYDETEHFVEPTRPTLLGRLQSAMLHLTQRSSDEPREELPALDDSILVHSCHSPMREAEVLRDHLLAWFNDDPTLQPRDVVVMVPDLDTYAPLLEAVLGQPDASGLRLPFSIADRSPRSGGLGAALWQVLEVARGRFAAAEVISLLEREPIRRRFNLTVDDLEIIREWVAEAEIRWGRDAAHVAAHAVAEGNTWRAGLSRLLMSFALGGDEETVACGVARSVRLDGGDARVLGGLCSFAQMLLGFAEEAEHPASAAEWAGRFERLLRALFDSNAVPRGELDTVRAALTALREAGTLAGCTDAISLEVVLEHLGGALGEDRRGSGYLVGAVTVCGLKPMRSVPFRVVCLLGMNHGVFPRQTSPLTFDLAARRRLPGDSSPRDDDRYLFLETLLSARDRLHLSHVGQSQRDGKDVPPSVVVSELLDALDHEFTAPPGAKLLDHLVVRHRLQAFSPAYFSGGRLFSFSSANHAAALALQSPRQPLPPPLVGQVSEAAEELREVDLPTLERFFRNPAAYLAERRLKLRLPRRGDVLEADERLSVDRRENYQLVETSVAAWRDKLSAEDVIAVQSAAGRLPPGVLDAGERRRIGREAGEFWKRIEPELRGGERWLDGSVELSGMSLSGRVRLDGGRLVRFRYSKLDGKPEQQLAVWLELLFANVVDPSVREALLIGRDDNLCLCVPESSEDVLKTLLHWYRAGLQEALPFAPRSSYALASKMLGKVRQESERDRLALDAARAQWQPKSASFQRGPDPESDDPFLRLAFAGIDLPTEPRFAEVSLAVFGPLLRARAAKEAGE